MIGNFTQDPISLKANIKAFNNEDIFINSIDLNKNRDCQKFVFNLMDKFMIRDQLLLENDLLRIIEVIEKYCEKKADEKKKVKPALTEYQKDIGIKFLKNPKLLDEIENDITDLGYVRERKNKILIYLIMTSRADMAVIFPSSHIGRGSALTLKSMIVEGKPVFLVSSSWD